MIRPLACISVTALLTCGGFGQAPRTPPAFEIADVHISARTRNPTLQGGVLRGGRYELRTANMVDLIRTAYGVDADNVVGGPSWLESDRFDVIAKAPPSTPPETIQLMLQTLLADRFKLVVHRDTRPMPSFVLSMGKGKPKLKQAEGGGSTGCQPQPSNPPQPGVPYMTLSCRNMTMAEFAPSLRNLAGAYITNPGVDLTGLKGAWDFEIKWTPKGMLPLAGADGITIFDAVDRQLGLKLELQKIATPVIVVDSVNQKPTGNPPGVTTAVPPAPPAEFEVATIRPSQPGAPPGGPGFQPGGRIDMRSVPLSLLIRLAWDVNPGEELVGAPKWLEMNRPVFDLVAKASTTGNGPANSPRIDNGDLRLMLRALLADRFKLATHYENRPVDAYTLVAAKPKLKKADPSNRTGCKVGPSQAARAPGDTARLPFQAVCLNTTMAQFAEQLPAIAPVYIRYPALDATGIEGAWDFTLTFSSAPPSQDGGGGRGGTKSGPTTQVAGNSPAGVGEASDPSGSVSLFSAVERQLGLKLEMHKRPMPVLVIDHLEEKPTEN